jgi:ribosome-binding ATPase YchF (GTP1/OBG family)
MFENEFDLWLRALVLKDWEKISRTAQTVKEHIAKHMEEKLTGLGINRFQILKAVNDTGLNGFNSVNWTEKEFNRFILKLRTVSKPLIVAANKADRDGAEINVKRIFDAGYKVIPTCAEAELALRRAAGAGLVNYIPGDNDFKILRPEKLTKSQFSALGKIREKVFNKWGNTGLQKVLNSAFYNLLNMITVYPVEDSEKFTDHQGHVLPDCFLVPKGTNAKQFAEIIHTELAEGFIHAIDARTKKRIGDKYILKENDVIQIVSAKSRR